MTTFGTMKQRIASELRRSNIVPEIGASINDAIAEAAKERFWFNEVEAQTFVTVPGQALYPDLGMTAIDDMYILEPSGYRRYIWLMNAEDVRAYLDGTQQSGVPDLYHIRGEAIRLYPVPNQVWTIAVDGFGRLTPWPMAADADTNAWMTHGERYIRAKAKSILFKDVVRDFAEATAYEAIADDFRLRLMSDSEQRIGTNKLQGYGL